MTASLIAAVIGAMTVWRDTPVGAAMVICALFGVLVGGYLLVRSSG